MCAWSGGNFTRANPTWTTDAGLGIGIEAGRHDTQDNDFTTGINECLNKTGQNQMTGNLHLGGSNRITNLGAATARTDAPQVAQVQDGDFIWLGTTAGTATAQTASATPAITAYKAGQKFRALIGAGLSSTGATPTTHTLNINSIGAKTIVHNGSGGSLTFGSFVAGRIIEFVYDGTYMVITNDPGAWQTYTPTLRYGASTLAKTVQYAKYKRTGNLLHAQFYLQVSALAAASGDISVELPVNVLNYAIRSIGGGYFFDSAPGVSYVCCTLIANGNSDRVYFINDASGSNIFGSGPAITMNTGDGLLFDLHYEV